MSQIIKVKSDVTVTDITAEAKEILAHAMNNFCTPQGTKEDRKKNAYLCERENYWMGLGYTLPEAKEKALEDYSWAF